MKQRTRMYGAASAGLLFAAGCSEDLDGPPPEVSGVEPALFCAEQIETTVSLDGSELSPTVFDSLTDDEGAVLPQIDLTRSMSLEGDGVDGEAIRVPDGEEEGFVRWQSQNEMEFDVTPDLGLQPGVYDITATNPAGDADTLEQAIAAVPRPVVDEIEPEQMCVAQGAQSFELRGSGFLAVDGDEPEVEVNGAIYEPESMSECSEIAVPGGGVEACSSLTVTIPEDDLEPDTYDVVVHNPEPAQCASSDEIQLEITPPPQIDDTSPQTLCQGGGTITVEGEYFHDDATVFLDDIEADITDVQSDELLEARFGDLGETGSRTLSVQNPDGCYAEHEATIEITEGIIVFFADPPVVFNGINTQITVLVSGLEREPSSVVLVSPDGDEIDVSDSIVFNRAGQVQVVVPQGLEAGEYGIQVEEGETNCETFLDGALEVTDEVTLALDAIDPPFAGEGINTGVEMRAEEDPGEGEVQFARTPRAYLNPVGEEEDPVATEIGAVSFEDETRLTGIVESGAEAGDYDVIVVNPEGEVGLLENAFTVTEEPPPVIDLVSPGTLEPADGQETTVFGSNFRDPEVDFICQLPDETIVTLDDEVVVDDVRTDEDPEEIDITADAGALERDTVCVVRAENDDGSFFEFTAINLANPQDAENAFAFVDGPNLNIPRRSPAATGADAGVAGSFVYAIGGDDGELSGAERTVEAASVGRFGDLSEWSILPIELPSSRTFARAVTVGRDFIYLAGGFDGDGGVTTPSTLRARVLDPDDRPVLDSLDIRLEDEGIDPGVWFYRLSIVVEEGSPQDPGGGEILASDPLGVNIPELDDFDEELEVVLLWDEVPEAVEYRLYRTPEPDLASGDELLLATLDPDDPDFEPRFVDNGVPVDSAEIEPLPLGTTGVWHEIDDPSGDVVALDTQRQAHDLTSALEPADVEDVVPGDVGITGSFEGTHHIYAAGGEEDGNAQDPIDLASVERLSIEIDSFGNQTIVSDGWVAETAMDEDPNAGGDAARRNLQIETANAFTAPRTEDQTFLYTTGGTQGDSRTSLVQAIEVLEGGELDVEWISGTPAGVPGMGRQREAHASLIANDLVTAIGGTRDATAEGGQASRIQDNPPDLGSWSDLAGAIDVGPRGFMGNVVQSSFYYLIGGIDPLNGDTVLDTTEQSVVGGQP